MGEYTYYGYINQEELDIQIDLVVARELNNRVILHLMPRIMRPIMYQNNDELVDNMYCDNF